MRRKILLFVGVFLFMFSLFGIIEPHAREKVVENKTAEMEKTISSITTNTPTPTEKPVLGEYMEVPTSTPEPTPSVTPEPTPKFNIEWIKELGINKNCSQQDYLDAVDVGLVEVPDSDISVVLRYGTYYKKNIKYTAGMTEFSDDERLYILGHNYDDGTIFHNLLFTEIGEKVVVTLANEEQSIADRYTFEVVFAKRYTEEEYEANNHVVFTDNPDYEGEYDLVLATCRHYIMDFDGNVYDPAIDDVSNVKKQQTLEGRYVLLCKLIEKP